VDSEERVAPKEIRKSLPFLEKRNYDKIPDDILY
jgi:hypothetical protein